MNAELEATKKRIWPERYDNPDGCPVLWEGKLYYGIREFDCIKVSLYTEPTKQGGYFTVIPISSAEFRRDNPTKAKVYVIKRDEWTEFTIWDDWGEGHEMKIHNSLSAEIEAAIAAAKKHELPISPRPIKDLLVLLREYAPEYVASEGSLCQAAGKMWGNNVIDMNEVVDIGAYIYRHKPGSQSDDTFARETDEEWWPEGEIEPRLEFLDKLIEELK